MRFLLFASFSGCMIWAHGCHTGGHDDDLNLPRRPRLVLSVHPCNLNEIRFFGCRADANPPSLSNGADHDYSRMIADFMDRSNHNE